MPPGPPTHPRSLLLAFMSQPASINMVAMSARSSSFSAWLRHASWRAVRSSLFWRWGHARFLRRTRTASGWHQYAALMRGVQPFWKVWEEIEIKVVLGRLWGKIVFYIFLARNKYFATRSFSFFTHYLFRSQLIHQMSVRVLHKVFIINL